VIELGVNVDHVATVRQARARMNPIQSGGGRGAPRRRDGITCHLREDGATSRTRTCDGLRELTHIRLNLEMAATDEMVGIAARIKPEMRCWCRKAVPRSRRGRPGCGFPGKTAAGEGEEAGGCRHRRVGVHRRRAAPGGSLGAHRRFGVRIHTGPYAHIFHSKGRDAETPAVQEQLKKIQAAGDAIRGLGMRFNAGQRSTTSRAAGGRARRTARAAHRHAIVSVRVVGMREAVRQMKQLMVQAAK